MDKLQALRDLSAILGAENIITEEEALKEHDSDDRCYAKSFGLFTVPLPLCIAMVKNTDQIKQVLHYCQSEKISVIPRTGASAYEGLLSCENEHSIILDASSMNQIIRIDEANMMATCECGVPLQTLEDLLQKKGLTTGHSPQSLPVAQMGGLVATRSIGQFSTYYGGIEDLLCGLKAILPDGTDICIRNVPRRSTGPDLRQLFVGSEGAFGFITEVTVKIFKYYPDSFWRGAYVVPNFTLGLETLRKIITDGYRPSVVRLYDKADYDHNYGNIELAEGEAYLFFLAEGPPGIAKATGEAIEAYLKEASARYIGAEPVDYWMIHRNDLCNTFRTKELREKFKATQSFYATTEISASWTDIGIIYGNVMARAAKEVAGLVNFGGHVSHSYQNGTNIYFVYTVEVPNPADYVAIHQQVVDIICEEVLRQETGGCAHHHGMGKMRVKFAPQEHGSSYVLMQRLKDMMDPAHMMNPGVLLAKE